MSELGHGMSSVAQRTDHLRIPVTHSTEEDSWLVTYLDVITLLLVMFVVMLALSGGPSEAPGERVSLTLTEAEPSALGPEAEQTPPDTYSKSSADRARATLQAAGLSDDITVIPQQDGIRFRISNDILFGSGEAVLSAEGIRQLENLVPLLADSDDQVTVAGHTDSLPIQTPRFPSNWELSSARAGSVVRLFEAAGVDRSRLQAAGYADTRPLYRNDTEQGRSRNRRVEIILEYGSMIKGHGNPGANRR